MLPQNFYLLVSVKGGQPQGHGCQDRFRYQPSATKNKTRPSRSTVYQSESEPHAGHRRCDDEPAQIQNVFHDLQSGATSPFRTCSQCRLTSLHTPIVASSWQTPTCSRTRGSAFRNKLPFQARRNVQRLHCSYLHVMEAAEEKHRKSIRHCVNPVTIPLCSKLSDQKKCPNPLCTNFQDNTARFPSLISLSLLVLRIPLQY